MKKIVFFIAIAITLFSCNQSQKDNQEITLLRGEFILTKDAGVLKGKDFIYGVELNPMAQELGDKVKPLKREEYDMVPVVINGVIKPNPNDGWEEIVEIKEIIGITRPTAELPTKIKSADSDSTVTKESTK